jgi:hypothetical protein
MELESGSSSVDWRGEAGVARVTPAAGLWRASASASAGGQRSITRSAHTTPETWTVTWRSMTTLTMLHAHDVSKLTVTVASWSADRIAS